MSPANYKHILDAMMSFDNACIKCNTQVRAEGEGWSGFVGELINKFA